MLNVFVFRVAVLASEPSFLLRTFGGPFPALLPWKGPCQAVTGVG